VPPLGVTIGVVVAGVVVESLDFLQEANNASDIIRIVIFFILF